MDREELRRAARILHYRGITEGKGPIVALANRLRVPQENFYNLTSRNRRISGVLASHVELLLSLSEDLKEMPEEWREWLLEKLKAPTEPQT